MGGLVTDAIYKRTGDFAKARRNTIISLLGSMACLAPLLFIRKVELMALSLSGAFFFLELTIEPIWSVPMDIAPNFSGVASGIMNTGSAVAAIVSPLAFGLITDITGSYTLPFLASIVLLLGGAVLTFWMRPDLLVHAEEEGMPEALAQGGSVIKGRMRKTVAWPGAASGQRGGLGMRCRNSRATRREEGLPEGEVLHVAGEAPLRGEQHFLLVEADGRRADRASSSSPVRNAAKPLLPSRLAWPKRPGAASGPHGARRNGYARASTRSVDDLVRVMGMSLACPPNEAAATRLIGAILLERSDE